MYIGVIPTQKKTSGSRSNSSVYTHVHSTMASQIPGCATSSPLAYRHACASAAESLDIRAKPCTAQSSLVALPPASVPASLHVAPLIRFRLFFDVPVGRTQDTSPVAASNTPVDKLVVGFRSPLHTLTVANLVHTFTRCVSARYPSLTSSYAVGGVRTCHRDTYMDGVGLCAPVEPGRAAGMRCTCPYGAASLGTWYGWYMDVAGNASRTLDTICTANAPAGRGGASYDLVVEWVQCESAAEHVDECTSWQLGFEMADRGAPETTRMERGPRCEAERFMGAWTGTGSDMIAHGPRCLPPLRTSYVDRMLAMELAAPQHSARYYLCASAMDTHTHRPCSSSPCLPFLSPTSMDQTRREMDAVHNVLTRAHERENCAARAALCVAESDACRRLVDAELSDWALLRESAADSLRHAALLVDLSGNSLTNGKIATLLRRQRGADSRHTRVTFRHRSHWSDPAPPADAKVHSLFDTEPFRRPCVTAAQAMLTGVTYDETRAALRTVLDTTVQLTRAFADETGMDQPTRLAGPPQTISPEDGVSERTLSQPCQRRRCYRARKPSHPTLSTTSAEAAIEALLQRLHAKPTDSDAASRCVTNATALRSGASASMLEVTAVPSRLSDTDSTACGQTGQVGGVRTSRVAATECGTQGGGDGERELGRTDEHMAPHAALDAGCTDATVGDATREEGMARCVFHDLVVCYREGRHEITRYERIAFREMMTMVQLVVTKQHACEAAALRRAYAREIDTLTQTSLFDI